MGILIGIIIAIAVLGVLYCFMAGAREAKDGEWMKTWSFAHRGLHNERMPENSMDAFQSAIEHGYAIEVDVHLSKMCIRDSPWDPEQISAGKYRGG